MLFPACAAILGGPAQEPLSDEVVETVTARIQEQGNKVASFYSTGNLLIEEWYRESESHILIVGTKEPFRIKIEVTHPWGQPVLHILIDQTRLKILSFLDKKLFLGTFTPEALSRFFPGNLDSDLIWGALRGYPSLPNHNRIVSLKGNQISLFNEKEKKVEIVDLYPETLLPKLVSFPSKHIKLAFSDFQDEHGIFYARKVKVGHIKGIKNLTLRSRKMVFNKTIPEQIFVLEKPPGFEVSYLDKGSSNSDR